MKLTFLGTGSAFTQSNWQTNALVEFDDGYRLLIDCGTDIRHALNDVKLYYLDIDGVYLSHLHSDHIGGLEWLAFGTFFDPRYQKKPDLFVSEFLVDDLWNRSLSGGLGSLQGQRCTLETYFDVHPVEKNGSFQVNGTKFTLVQTIHFVNGFTFELSFGLLFPAGDEMVFLTTDTQFAPNQIKDFYERATVIFHDAECAPFKSGVHAHFDELVTLPKETREKLWLVHYQDDVLDLGSRVNDLELIPTPEWQEKSDAAGFHGFVYKGQVFEF
jgi:ribonuclease BN (tRNA processing enzyme)